MSHTEFEDFRENMDAWVKQIRKEVSEYKDIPEVLRENIDNTQYNYELFMEMREELSKLKEELKTLKLLHAMMIENQVAKG